MRPNNIRGGEPMIIRRAVGACLLAYKKTVNDDGGGSLPSLPHRQHGHIIELGGVLGKGRNLAQYVTDE